MNPFEILPGVLRWSAYSPAHKVELTSHAVVTPDLTLIFDPILPHASLHLPASLQSRIVITNANHERDMLEASRLWNAEIWGPPGVEFSPPITFQWGDGQSVGPGWHPIPLPGGADGETAFHCPSRSLMVFGDAVVNLPGRSLEILPEKYCRDRPRLAAALRTLPEFDHAVFAHGLPLMEKAADRIRSLA
ncbi:MAG: hypothetical protein JNL10_21970 [Verrucomicrobiales bacterium]|nr:hypothetical protein [Verrucomicrobiales bacterium]